MNQLNLKLFCLGVGKKTGLACGLAHFLAALGCWELLGPTVARHTPRNESLLRLRNLGTCGGVHVEAPHVKCSPHSGFDLLSACLEGTSDLALACKGAGPRRCPWILAQHAGHDVAAHEQI